MLGRMELPSPISITSFFGFHYLSLYNKPYKPKMKEG